MVIQIRWRDTANNSKSLQQTVHNFKGNKEILTKFLTDVPSSVWNIMTQRKVMNVYSILVSETIDTISYIRKYGPLLFCWSLFLY